MKYIRVASLTELGHGPRPQVHLGQRSRGMAGVDPGVVAKGVRGPHRVAGVVDVQMRGPDEEGLAGLGEQPAEGVEVHTRHPVRPNVPDHPGPSGTRGDEC